MTIFGSWADKHSCLTILFEACASDVRQVSQSSQSATLLAGIDRSTAQVIMKQTVARDSGRRSLQKVRYVRIDQMGDGKGQDDVTVLTGIEQPCFPGVTPDCKMESADALWKTLSHKQPNKVQVARLEIWQASSTSAETNRPNVVIVRDRFHIAKYPKEVVDSVRSVEHCELQQSGGGRRKGMRQTLVFNQEHLSD